MKVNNLLKKVGSVITTAALLATLGTTAFADAPEKYTDSNEGTGIKITDVRTEQVGTSDIYKVTVDYYTTVDNLTGMTMMMYTKNDINDPSSLEKPRYEASMKIVGIDQQAGKKGATGTAADDADKKGSFVFNITTNESGSNGYYVKKGVPALIAVSGDQCTPAYALCGVNAVADSATINVTKVTQDAPANATDEEIKGLLNNNDDVMNAKIDIRDANKDLITQAGVSDATASGWEKQADGTFKNTYTFAQGCKTVSGVDLQKAISVSIVATITKTAVNANTVSSVDGLTAKEGSVNTFEKTYSADQNTEESVIKDALFKDKTAKIANGIATGTVTLESGWAKSTGTAYDKSADEDQNLVYEVTIPNTATVTGNEYLKIAADGLKFTVNVTVSRTQYISAITLDGAPGSIDVSSTATDDQIKEALNKAIKNATIKIDETEADKSKLTMEWVIARTENVPTSAKLHVSAVDSSLGNLPASGIDVTPAIAIKVKTGSNYGLADLNGDGSVDAQDAAEVMKKFFNSAYEFKDSNGEVIGDVNAKLTKDEDIDAADAAEVMKKFFNSAYKFPIEL